MVKWFLRILGLGLLLGIPAFFIFAPAAFENLSNPVGKGPWPVSPRAQALHKSLVVMDLHADTLMWKRDPRERVERAHVDLPRLKEGNMGLQVFSSVTKVPFGQNYESNPSDSDVITFLVIGQLQPTSTWFNLLNRSLWHAEKLQRAEGTPDGFRIVRTVRDLDEALAARAAGKDRTLALLSLEGMQGVETPADLDKLMAAGFRMGGLAHFFDNQISGSVHGEAKGGLTPFGREVVKAMEAKGMVVDLAHSSHATIADVLKIATKPVVASHGGVKGTCNNNRNLSDAEVLGIARTGGVIGLGLWDQAVCATDPKATAKAMRYVRDLAGIEAVALGGDMDGSVKTPFDVSGMAALTQALIDEGFTDDEIRAAMGGNTLRVLRQTLPAA